MEYIFIFDVIRSTNPYNGETFNNVSPMAIRAISVPQACNKLMGLLKKDIFRLEMNKKINIFAKGTCEPVVGEVINFTFNTTSSNRYDTDVPRDIQKLFDSKAIYENSGNKIIVKDKSLGIDSNTYTLPQFIEIYYS